MSDIWTQIKQLFKHSWKWIAIGTVIIGTTGLYFAVSWHKHWHFQTFAWDTAVFVQTAYLFSRLTTPLSSLHQGMHILGDHFQVLTLVLSGVCYRLFPKPEAIFLLQALWGTASAIPLYLLAQQRLKKTALANHMPIVLGLALVIAYLFSVSFQGMMTDEFHNEPLAALPLILMFYFLETKQNWGYWLSFLALLLTKEIFGIVGILLGLYIWWVKKRANLGKLTSVLGLTMFLLLILGIMPHFARGKYYHFTPGNQPRYLLNKFVSQPELLVTEFFNHPNKRATLLATLLAFAFLPLLAPAELGLALSVLAIRFFDDTTPRLYIFNNHYAVPFLPLMALAAIEGIKRLLSIVQSKTQLKINTGAWLVVGGLLLVTGIQTYLFHGALNSLLKPAFYQVATWEQDAHKLLDQVPKGVVVASQNSLLPHLADRENFYLLPEIGEAEYIAVDLHPGPNKFSPATQEEIQQLINHLINTNTYQIIWQQNQSMLLKKQ